VACSYRYCIDCWEAAAVLCASFELLRPVYVGLSGMFDLLSARTGVRLPHTSFLPSVLLRSFSSSFTYNIICSITIIQYTNLKIEITRLSYSNILYSAVLSRLTPVTSCINDMQAIVLLAQRFPKETCHFWEPAKPKPIDSIGIEFFYSSSYCGDC
jgi:hypothetical protein